MKLKDGIVQQINNVRIRRNLTVRLDCSDQMIQKHLTANKKNGRLTRMDALIAIASELDINDVMDLIEKEVISV